MSNGSKKGGHGGHGDPNQGSRDQYKRHIDGSVTVHGQLETHLPPDLQQKQDAREEQQDGRDKKKFIVEVLTLISVTIYAGLTLWQACLIRESNRTSHEAFQISQRSSITVGRKDGVVAEIVVPKDVQQNAEIIIYFQNTGHLPAKFVWGTIVPFLAKGTTTKNSGINYVHPFPGFMWRRRNHGSIGESGESTVIAGESVLAATLGTIPQSELQKFPSENLGLMIVGMFEYCDEIGTHAIRNFGITYRSNAPNPELSFALAQDTAFPIAPLPKPDARGEPLPPCKTPDEH